MDGVLGDMFVGGHPQVLHSTCRETHTPAVADSALCCLAGAHFAVGSVQFRTDPPNGGFIIGAADTIFSPAFHRHVIYDNATTPPLLRRDDVAMATIGFSADGHRLITVAPMHYASADNGAVWATGNVFDFSSAVTPSAPSESGTPTLVSPPAHPSLVAAVGGWFSSPAC